MNPIDPEENEPTELEQGLRQLSPAAPSESLTARIFANFETPSDAAPADVADVLIPLPNPNPRSTAWSQPFASAAAVALIAGIIALIGLSRSDQPEENEITADNRDVIIDSKPVSFVPTHAQNTYQGSKRDEIVFTEDRRPLRVVRYRFIDTFTWENPEDGSRVVVHFPVERIRYIPIPTD